MPRSAPLLGVILLTLGPVAGPSPVSGGTGTLVVLNKSDATASLIDLASGSPVRSLPTGTGPHEVAVSPDGRLAVVSNYGTLGSPGSTLTVLDIPEGGVLRTIRLGRYRRPHGIAWIPGDPRRVVVTAEESRSLLTVDVSEGRVTGSVETDQDVSHMVAMTPDGSRAFVANIGSGSVTAIELTTGKKLAIIPTGAGAEGIDVTPDGRQVWITNRAADTVSVLDAKTLEVVARLKSGTFPIRAKATPDGRFVIVSNARAGDLAVFDTASRKEVRRVPMKLAAASTEGRLFGGQFGESPVPIGILIQPDGKRAYVSNTNADLVAVLDLARWEIVGTLKAGKEPDGLGYSPLRVRGTLSSTDDRRGEAICPLSPCLSSAKSRLSHHVD